MRAGQHNIEIENGSTFEMNLEINEDDGTAYSLTGYAVDMQIRTSTGTLILDCGSFVSIANGNEIDVAIPPASTASITQTEGLYQIEISLSGKEHSLLRGNVKFISAVIQ